MAVLAAGRARRWKTPDGKPFLPVRTQPAVQAPKDPEALKVGIITEVVWAPQPGPQTAGITCPVEDLFYGGARGGGKTDYLIGDFAAHAGRYGENARGIIFRRTYSELEEVERRALQVYGRLGWTYNSSKRQFTAPNGAVLRLRYLLRKADAAKYQGHSYTWMAFDEAGNWPSAEPLDLLWACLRSAVGVPCVRRVTGNPGGPGHLWLRARYVEPHPEGMLPFRYQPQPEDNPNLWVEAVYIPSTVDDNLLLVQNDPGYINRIAASAHGNKALWQAWRFGDWWVVPGAAFSEWRSDVHVAKFAVPLNWRWAAGGDWGYSSPGWIGLGAFGPSGEQHLRWEWYYKKTTPYEVGYQLGSTLKRLAGKELIGLPEYLALDSACFSTTYQGAARKSEAEEIQRGLVKALGKLAFPVVPAPKGGESRVVRKNLMHDGLFFREEEDGRILPHNRPKFTVHPDCKAFVRTVPALPLDEKDPEKVDTEAEDHPFDGWTYLLAARTPQAERAKAVKGGGDPDRADGYRSQVEQWKASHPQPGPAQGGRRWSRGPVHDEDDE